MAKLERILHEDFDRLTARIEQGILRGSSSATLKESSDFAAEGARCSVRVFERYSYLGSNRVSMNVTLFQPHPQAPVQLCAITSGGSQAMFFKMNTFGEESFLQKLEKLL